MQKYVLITTIKRTEQTVKSQKGFFFSQLQQKEFRPQYNQFLFKFSFLSAPLIMQPTA